ncbi:BTAD domain-containing putative transcriptional regulator [Amycolatopsis sp. NPDC058986]|uniref:AfsR/SARP family transcriptional regulator n=1 Tax=unclassified Amycolatopsis TaxID=2618356 RepID=UPI00366E254C
MRFRVLGPVRIWDGEDWVAVRAAQPRSVLALLLVEAGRVVATDRLVDELWGACPPRTALNTVQVYVNRLRRLLGEDGHELLATTGRGYRLTVADGELDAGVFQRLVESGQRELAEGRAEAAAATLAAALALWRGPAFSEVPAETAVAEATRLDQLRLTALEARLDADLRLGRHLEVVDEVQDWVVRHPLRERLLQHLMLALYRCGRRAEALQAYRRGRARLVAELGLEPGPALRELERAVLSDDPRLAPEPARVPLVRPVQLPADVAGFTGREPALAELDRLLADTGEAPTALLVSVITGTAGVGKTALALHWAHRVRKRFDDGQLFADLRGYSAGVPARPITVLTRFLRALGVPVDEIPTSVDEAAALYRSILADRRMLVVLDNARDAEQARPLLPGSNTCVVLITSRTPLSGLVARDGARSLPLGLLTASEAEALLRRVLGPARAGPVGELAGLCAGLPLALRIAAAHLHTRPGLSIGHYAEQLRDDRLTALSVPDEKQLAVRTAFDLSYRRLGDDAQRLFRLLGAAPVADFTVGTAAALAAVSEADAGRFLAELTMTRLLDEHRPGRYHSHDLLRLYARERAVREDDTDTATDRLLAWYLATTDQAANALYPQMRRLTLPAADAVRSAFAEHTEAAAWLDAERPNLLAVVTDAARHRPVASAGLLADALRGYFWLRMHTVDWLTAAEAALDIAKAVDDPRGTVTALLSLADVHYRQGHSERAEQYSIEALTMATDTGWPDGQAAAHGNLGNLAAEAGHLADAADHHQASLTLNRRTGRRTKQANNLCSLGNVHLYRGDLREAFGWYTDALALYRELRSASGQALAMTELGVVQHDLGNLDEAARCLTAALAGHQETGDRGTEAATRAEIAAVRADAGHYDEAFDQAHAARVLARAARDRAAEAEALIAVGVAHHLLGHRAEAASHYREARELGRAITHRFAEAKALIGLAAVRNDPGDARAALALARRHGYRLLEGQALLVLTSVDSERAQAIEEVTRVHARFAEIGHRLGEARARLVLARLHGRDGHHSQSRVQRRNAVALFHGIGAPWTDHANALPAAP